MANFKRKIDITLIEWAKNEHKKPLIIEGARQVGKTTSILNFSSTFYGEDRTYDLDFVKTPKLCRLFERDIDLDVFKQYLDFMYPSKRATKYPRLVFMDEIQVCPRAITALKYLSQLEGYDFIVSGSLLGLSYAKTDSFPVGYVRREKMYPLDFDEFLWAAGVSESFTQQMVQHLSNMKAFDVLEHEIFLDYFKSYLVVGGMPEIVHKFIESKDYAQVYEAQKQLLKSIKQDIAKYADSHERLKVNEIFDSLPIHLSKDYKKFQYKLVSKQGRGRTYDSSIQWLIDAGLILQCFNVSHLDKPLKAYQRLDAFKLYFFDIGLLMASLGNGAQLDVLFGDLGIFKGALYENSVAIMLNDEHDHLYNYERNSTLEIDFVVNYVQELVGIEVKSSSNTKSKSLDTLLNQKEIDFGFKIGIGNFAQHNNKFQIPIYCAHHIKNHFSQLVKVGML